MIKNKIIILIIFLLLTGTAGRSDIDPGVAGQPARVQGAGMSVSWKNDINNLFLNPAFIEHKSDYQFMSMYGNIMSQVDYTLLGVSFPLWGNTIGIGANLVNGGAVKYAEDFEDYTGNPILSEKEYKNELYQFTIARSFRRGLNKGLPLVAGLSAKLYRQGLSNTDLYGQGFGLDLGIAYNLLPNISLSFAAKNPYSSISWESGRTEEQPPSYLFGINSDWLATDLAVGAGVELRPETDISLLRGGVEYNFKEVFTLRAGYKERPFVDSVNEAGKKGAISLGAGMRMGDFSLDYAYVPYYALSEDTSHYITLSYMPFHTRKEVFDVNIPVQSTIFYVPYILIEGSANQNILEVSVNKENVEVKDRRFIQKVPLDYKENEITVRAFGNRGKEFFVSRNVFRLKQFNDIPADYEDHLLLDIIYTYGIVTGDAKGNFYPQRNIERSGFVAAMMKLKGKVKKVYYQRLRQSNTMFKVVSDILDFDSRDWAAEYLAQAKKENIVVGYPDSTIRQQRDITRAEAMVIVARLEDIEEEDSWQIDDPDVDLERPEVISWVKETHWAYPYVKVLAKAGFLDYIDENKMFVVNDLLSEAERKEFYFGIDQVKGSTDSYEKFLNTAAGSKMFYAYLREVSFVKKPLKRIELFELIARTSLFKEFLQNIGLLED